MINEKVKKMIDRKIHAEIFNGESIDSVINYLEQNRLKFKSVINKNEVKKSTKRYEYLESYVMWSETRIGDLVQMKSLSLRFKLDNSKLFKLVEFKTK